MFIIIRQRDERGIGMTETLKYHPQSPNPPFVDKTGEALAAGKRSGVYPQLAAGLFIQIGNGSHLPAATSAIFYEWTPTEHI